MREKDKKKSATEVVKEIKRQTAEKPIQNVKFQDLQKITMLIPSI